MAPEHIDPYAVLKVDSGATQQQIRDAYRSQLRQSHPDMRTPDAPRADRSVQQLVDAYAVLRDPVLRAAYDQRAIHEPAALPIHVRVRKQHGPQSPIQAGPVHWHS
jgi:DnaJ-class molecular chaperone